MRTLFLSYGFITVLMLLLAAYSPMLSEIYDLKITPFLLAYAPGGLMEMGDGRSYNESRGLLMSPLSTFFESYWSFLEFTCASAWCQVRNLLDLIRLQNTNSSCTRHKRQNRPVLQWGTSSGSCCSASWGKLSYRLLDCFSSVWKNLLIRQWRWRQQVSVPTWKSQSAMVKLAGDLCYSQGNKKKKCLCRRSFFFEQHVKKNKGCCCINRAMEVFPTFWSQFGHHSVVACESQDPEQHKCHPPCQDKVPSEILQDNRKI